MKAISIVKETHITHIIHIYKYIYNVNMSQDNLNLCFSVFAAGSHLFMHFILFVCVNIVRMK